MGKTLWSSILDDAPDPTHRIWATPAEITCARRNIQGENFEIGDAIETGDLIVDRNAATSRSEKGLWVSAWIWLDTDEVDDEGLPLPDTANDVSRDPIVERLERLLDEGVFDIEEDAP